MLWLTGLLECRSFLCVRSCRPPSESFSTRAFKVRSLANCTPHCWDMPARAASQAELKPGSSRPSVYIHVCRNAVPESVKAVLCNDSVPWDLGVGNPFHTFLQVRLATLLLSAIQGRISPSRALESSLGSVARVARSVWAWIRNLQGEIQKFRE